jgi:subtilisin
MMKLSWPGFKINGSYGYNSFRTGGCSMKRLKFLGSIVLPLSLLMMFFFVIGAAGASEENDQIRVLIKTDQLAQKANLKSHYGVRWEFEKKGFTTDVTPQQLEALKKLKDVNVSLVGQAHTMGTSQANTTRDVVPSDQTPWGIEAIYNDDSIPSTTGGKGIRVAVLDTGVFTDHLDLSGNAEQCKDFTAGNGMKNGVCDDKNGHGTHVSGTILANSGTDGLGIYGVSPESMLWAYKVLGNGGMGFSDDIAAAIRHAADESERLGVNVVISMSLGSDSKSTLTADAITYAASKGVLVVAAAGNSGPDPDTIGYPGALDNAVGVAALEDVQENGTYRVADFSSRGNPDTAGDYVIVERDVEVSAPGRYVESTWNDGTYNTISGTSMATPHVSGLAAKIWATNPTWTHQQIRAELQNRATNNDINGGLYTQSGDDISSGFGFPLVQSTDQ